MAKKEKKKTDAATDFAAPVDPFPRDEATPAEPEKKPETSPAPIPRKVRMARFMTWAKEKGVVSTALGATVALKISPESIVTEADFNSALKKYGSQKTFNV